MADNAQATTTVTITLSRDDAQELFDNLDASLDSWQYTDGETIPYLERCRDVFKAALAAAPPPAPSEAHALFRDFRIVENTAIPLGMIISVAEDDIVVSYGDRVMKIAKTDLGALAARRSAGEGTS